MTKIDELIAAGEKATQGEWYFSTERAALCSHITPKSGHDFYIELSSPTSGLSPNHDAPFIVKAANAREDIKAMREENKRLREALESIATGKNVNSGVFSRDLAQQTLGDHKDDG